MNIIKKLLLILIGIFFSFILCETLLHLFKYEPLPKIVKNNNFDFDKFIKWAYVDIHESFFKIKDNFFYVQREDIWIPRDKIKKYSIDKSKNKKRIFILGESVARLYSEDILEKELLKYFSNVDIINAGMGGYDSYRIEKISKEICKLNPDYVIILIGNNDGIYDYWGGAQIDPVDTNYLPYKYPILKQFKTICLLSNLFYHEIKLTKNTVEENFKKNVIKIVENLKDTNVIFCDLPNNEYFVSADITENIKQNVSKKRYYESIWKNSFGYSQIIKRINFLKQTSKEYKNVYITNLTDILRNYTDNDLGYNIFFDDCHFEDATYLLLSKLITQIIIKKENNLELDLDLCKQEYNELLMHDIEKFIGLRRLQSFLKELSSNYSSGYNKIGILYKENKDVFYNEYKNAYEYFLKDNTDINYKIMFLYADVLQDNKEINKAKKLLNELIKLSPNNFEAYLILGYIEYKNNNFKEADKYFSKVKELNQDSDINVAYLKSLKKEN